MVIVVFFIVGGEVIKGFIVKMMEELGFELLVIMVVDKYKDFLDGFVFDRIDVVLEEEVVFF